MCWAPALSQELGLCIFETSAGCCYPCIAEEEAQSSSDRQTDRQTDVSVPHSARGGSVWTLGTLPCSGGGVPGLGEGAGDKALPARAEEPWGPGLSR